MDVGIAVVRIALGVVLVASGMSKLTPQLGFGGLRGTGAGFARLGLRGNVFSAAAAGVTQTGAGALLVLGLLTPLAGVAAAAVMLVASSTQVPRGFWAQRGGFEYPALLAVLCLALIWTGGGRFALDRLLAFPALSWPAALVATTGAVLVGVGAIAVLRTPRSAG